MGRHIDTHRIGFQIVQTYKRTVSFFYWIILGLIMGTPDTMPPGRVWIAAIVMVIGILLIAVNPLELINKNKED